jgi:hypothetical protein
VGADRGSKEEIGEMHTIKVISASPKAKRWLDHFTRARIINIFPAVVNLADDGNHLLSLVTPTVGNGPFSMVVDTPDLSLLVQDSDQISYADVRLAVGKSIFNLENTLEWDPLPNWLAIRRINRQELVIRIEQQLLNLPKKDGFAEVFYTDGMEPRSKFYSSMKKGAELLFEGLSGDDTEKMVTGGEALGGLGVGLTPSGDDFLVGTMFGLWASRPGKKAISTAELIWAGAAGQTTSLSREWLSAAVAGEAGEDWHKLVEALLAGNEELVDIAIERILTTGATSGADALCGFVQLIKLEEQG